MKSPGPSKCPAGPRRCGLPCPQTCPLPRVRVRAAIAGTTASGAVRYSGKVQRGRRHLVFALAVLGLLAVVAYLPALTQPLLEDDYPNLAKARLLGAPDQWRQLAGTVFRLRATSEWLFWVLYRAFGLWAPGYYAVSILLHVLDTWLAYVLGCSVVALTARAAGASAPTSRGVAGTSACSTFGMAFWAAAFFAIAEGHQEAVMWFSASNELLQFLFGVAAMVAWLRFLGGGWKAWYAACLTLFALALISKESAPVFAILFALPMVVPGWRKRARYLVPLAAMAAMSVLVTYSTRAGSFRFQDGSFSLHAPFWRIWPENFARVFWVWGLAGLAAALAWGWKRYRAPVLAGLAWAAAALLPYCFLMYSTRIPSRQTYLASAGVALVAAAGWSAARERFAAHGRALTAAVCILVLAHNLGYLWIKKRRQFLERAQPTEELIAFARRSSGPIYIACFPRTHIIAEDTVRLALGEGATVIWDEEEARARGVKAGFCFRER